MARVRLRVPRATLPAVCLLTALACQARTAAAATETGPEAWLSRMEQALETRNYRGVFAHQQGRTSQSLRIVHRVRNGEVEERVTALDGSGREFIRRDGELFRYLPDQQMVLVEPVRDASMMLAELRHMDVTRSRQYVLRQLPAEVLSGRRVRVIAVQPRDRLRYGYRLWIDESSALPLKTQLLGSRGEVLEQLQFTELSLPKNVPDQWLQPEVDASGFLWQRQPDSGLAAIPSLSTTEASAWQSAALPPGFRMTVRSQKVLLGGTQPVTQLVFSDGLASVSVFVEAGTTPVAVDAMSAQIAQLGPSSAYSTVVQGYRVTAIGEVPPETLKAIAGAAVAPPAPAAAPAAAAAGEAPRLPVPVNTLRAPPVSVGRPPAGIPPASKR